MMKKIEEVEKEFSELAVVRGDILLFRAEDAIAFVRRCEKEGLSILGIDGICIDGDKTRPMMEHCVDYSIGEMANSHSKNKADQNFERAVAFIKERETKNMFFEIVVE